MNKISSKVTQFLIFRGEKWAWEMLLAKEIYSQLLWCCPHNPIHAHWALLLQEYWGNASGTTITKQIMALEKGEKMGDIN